MKNNRPFGLYLHVPFCASKCGYCDFYSFAGDTAQMDDYLQAMIGQMQRFSGAFAGREIDTVYFGGGTPSLLGAARLTALLHAIEDWFCVRKDAEITVECNPDSMCQTLLTALRRAGVNRLSIGVQTVHDDELRRLGRRHTFAQAVDAVHRAQAEAFKNLNLDLMYGLPEQTQEKWMQSVDALLALAPTHLSCYSLKLEPGTPLAQQNPVLPNGDTQADWYLALCERLRQAGYEHYEISNWAKPGFRSRHNSRYWTQAEYLGLGPGAHSYCFGKRFSYPPSLDAFCNDPQPVEEEAVPDFAAQEEYLMLRLRTIDGLPVSAFCERFGVDFSRYASRFAVLEKAGLAARTKDGWRLTENGFFVSNSILTDLFCVDER